MDENLISSLFFSSWSSIHCHRLHPSFSLQLSLFPSPSSFPFSHLLPHVPLPSPLSLPEPHSPVFYVPIIPSCSPLLSPPPPHAPPSPPFISSSSIPTFPLLRSIPLPHCSPIPSPPPPPAPTAAPPFNSAHCPSSPFHLRSCAPSSARKMPSSISRPFTPTPPRRRHAQAHFAEACVFILHTDANLRLKLPRGEHTLTLIQSSC